MRKMKWLVLLICCLFSCLLLGCGVDEEDIAGTIQQTEGTTASEQDEKPVTVGRFEGGTYTNQYLGIECELDSEWVYYSAEELQEIPDAVKDSMGDTDMAEVMADADQIMDMKAENTEELTLVNIVYTKVDLKERVTALTKGEEYVVDSVLDQADMMKDGYEAAGILVDKMEKVKVNFLGEERIAIKTTAVTEGIPYFTLQLFDYESGKYSTTLTFASYLEDKTEELLDLFQAIES